MVVDQVERMRKANHEDTDGTCDLILASDEIMKEINNNLPVSKSTAQMMNDALKKIGDSG